MNPPTGEDGSLSDEEFLDDLFDLSVEKIENGESIDVDSLAAARPHLRQRIEQCIDTARRLHIRPDTRIAEVAGFEILSELGCGAGGVVYLARQPALDSRCVAIKVLRRSALPSIETRHRFVREARALARVRSDHVVSIHDVVDDPDVCAIVMDWIEGESLAAHLRGLTAPSNRADWLRRIGLLNRVGISIGRALDTVHHAGLVHRDVKPSNILVRVDGRVLLSDFGLARGKEDPRLTLTGQLMGTPAYAAPELLRGLHDRVGPWTDVYSLGAVLFEIAANRLPVTADSISDFARVIETGRIPRLRSIEPRLSKDIETIVSKALDPDPSRRYRDGGELADDLERVEASIPIQARPPGVVRRVQLLAKRRRSAAIGILLGLALAAVIGAAVAFFAWRARHEEAFVSAARELLLDPQYAESALHESYTADLYRRPRLPELALAERLRRALTLYDSAAIIDGLRPTGIDRERNVVAVALEIAVEGDFSRAPDRLRNCLTPAIRGVAEAWNSALKRFQVEDPRFQAMSVEDRHSAGLLAFVLGDSILAERMLGSIETVESPDPFANLALGLAQLARNEPHRAYPRLMLATERFPESQLVHAAAADAATRCGDVEWARRLLAHAQDLSGPDLGDRIPRVTADFAFVDGDTARASTLYEYVLTRHDDGIAYAHYGRLRFVLGELAPAADLLARAYFLRPDDPSVGALMANIGSRWWSSLDVTSKRAAIENSLFDQSREGRGPGATLAAAIESRARIRDSRNSRSTRRNDEFDLDSEILASVDSPPSSDDPGRPTDDRFALLEDFMRIDRFLLPRLRPAQARFVATWIERSDSSAVVRGLFSGDSFRRSLGRLTLAVGGLISLMVPEAAARIDFEIQPFPVSVFGVGTGTPRITIADIDQDGDLDLLGGNSVGASQIWAGINDGSGLFTFVTLLQGPLGTRYGSIAVADINNDGFLDIAASRIDPTPTSGFTVLYGSGTGAYSAANILIQGNSITAGLVTADFDHDGDIDIALATYQSNTILVFANPLVQTGTATFGTPTLNLPTSGTASSLVAGDVNSDGRTDLIVGIQSGASLMVFLNAGLQPGVLAFNPTPSVNVGPNPQQISLIDLDGDSTLDLACGNSNGTVSVSFNRGGVGPGWAGFATSVTLNTSLPGTVTGIEAADLDSDGDRDLACIVLPPVTPTPPPPSLVVFTNNGTGTFTAASLCTNPTIPSEPRALASGDLDGDGDIDLVGGAGNGTTVPTVTGFIAWNASPSFYPYGNGCPGSGNIVPGLAGVGTPKPGQSFSVKETGGPPNATSILFYSSQPGNLALPGPDNCHLLVGTVPLFLLSLTTDPSGDWTISIVAPPGTPALNLYLQAFDLDSNAPNHVYSSTNGLRISIGC